MNFLDVISLILALLNEPGHDGYQFLFRFGIIHCIADSGVYGLLTTGNATSYPNNTWITATGTISLEYDKTLEHKTYQFYTFLRLKKQMRLIILTFIASFR